MLLRRDEPQGVSPNCLGNENSRIKLPTCPKNLINLHNILLTSLLDVNSITRVWRSPTPSSISIVLFGGMGQYYGAKGI